MRKAQTLIYAPILNSRRASAKGLCWTNLDDLLAKLCILNYDFSTIAIRSTYYEIRGFRTTSLVVMSHEPALDWQPNPCDNMNI